MNRWTVLLYDAMCPQVNRVVGVFATQEAAEEWAERNAPPVDEHGERCPWEVMPVESARRQP